MMRNASGLILAALLAACASSAPMRYYTLTPVAPATGASGTTSNVRLGHVTIPRELDRSELVQRIDATQLQLHEQDRWAASFEDLVRRALKDDLAARAPDSGASNAAHIVSIDIDEFIADASCNVTLRATWTLSQPNSPGTPKNERIATPAGGACTTGALPATMSRALGELTDRIAAEVLRK